MPYLVGAVGFLNSAAEFLHMPIDPLTVFEFCLKGHIKLEMILILPLGLLNQNQTIENM